MEGMRLRQCAFDIASFGACVQVCAYGTACSVEREGEGKAERGGAGAKAQ